MPALAVVLGACLLARVSVAVDLPPGFVAETLATNLNAATAIASPPDGRVFIADQTGKLLVWKEGALLKRPALILHVTDYWERGLIGLTLDPGFPDRPYLFAVYVTDRPFVHHVVSRFTMRGDAVDAASERVLFEGDDQATLGGSVPAGHQGGPIRFGPDGQLYIGLGEQTAGGPSQRLDTLQGKILRLEPDGSIPRDNPFFTTAAGKYRAIFAYGIRNPFGLAVQPGTGRMFFTDVGASAFEEVNDLVAGANYGWPLAEGFSTNRLFRQPLLAYSPMVGQCIVGGMFLRRDSAWPEKWRGRFFFGDFMKHWIKALDPAAPTNVVSFARDLNGPVAVELAPDGSLLVLNRGAIWRDPKRFVPNAGSLVRIRYTGVEIHPALPANGEVAALGLPLEAERLPRHLSETRVIDWLKDPNGFPNAVAYKPNVPLWEPGFQVDYAIAVPRGKRIGFVPDEAWSLPMGTAVVRQYRLASVPGVGSGLIETRLFVAGEDCAYGASYRWRPDGKDADLVEDPDQVTVQAAGLHQSQERFWIFPGLEPCLRQPEWSLAFSPMITSRQMIRDSADSPLHLLLERGLLDGAPGAQSLSALPRLARWDDASAPLELRVRSYLDVHCAACHQPGGASRGLYDARFSTPLDRAGILNGPLAAGDLGISGAKVVVPGDPEKSILYQRLKTTDFFRMPPVQYHNETAPILPLVEEWIRSLGDKTASLKK